MPVSGVRDPVDLTSLPDTWKSLTGRLAPWWPGTLVGQYPVG